MGNSKDDELQTSRDPFSIAIMETLYLGQRVSIKSRLQNLLAVNFECRSAIHKSSKLIEKTLKKK